MAPSLKTLAFLSIFFINFVQRSCAVPFHMENVRVFEDDEVCKDDRDDCYWIKQQADKYKFHNVAEYCETYKDDEPIKQCRLTCGMCKAPAPPECKDQREDCGDLITKTGSEEKLQQYCEKWRDDPAVRECPATCNMCDAASSPIVETRKRAEVECKDERPDCDRLITKTRGNAQKLEEYCNKWKDDIAVKQCPKTCGVCQPKLPSPTVECKDERPDCDRLKTKTGGDAQKLEEYCNKWKDDIAVKQCPKTCGVCQPKPPSPTGCKDDRDDCDWIKQQAVKYKFHNVAEYCETYKDDEPIKQCRLTCGMCDKAPAPTECKNERPDCDRLITKTRGDAKMLEEYCNKWKDDTAVKQCPVTCGRC